MVSTIGTGHPLLDIFPQTRPPSYPRYNMTSYGRRAFSYAGPHAWNSLPEHLRQTTSIDLFKRSLKNVFIRADIALRKLETFLFNGLYKSTYYLLTYLPPHKRNLVMTTISSYGEGRK